MPVVLPAFKGGGTIACDGGWFSMSQASFAVGKSFTYGENVDLQQRTFRLLAYMYAKRHLPSKEGTIHKAFSSP